MKTNGQMSEAGGVEGYKYLTREPSPQPKHLSPVTSLSPNHFVNIRSPELQSAKKLKLITGDDEA